MATTPNYNFMSPTQPVNLNQINQPAQGNIWSRQTPQTQAAAIQAGTALLGGALSQRNTNQQAQQQQQFQGQQADLNRQQESQALAQQLAQARMMAERQAAMQGATTAPSRQNWRQSQALAADVLPGLRNVSVQAPGNLQRFIPQISGGLRLPEGGLSSQALAFYSPEARLGAEQDLDRAVGQASGGRVATPDYAAAGYGSAIGNPATLNVEDYAAQIREQMDEERKAALNEALGIAPAAKGQPTANPFRRQPAMAAG